MYANLKVTTSKGKVLSAWKVEVEGNRTRVYLDDPNGPDDSYANPAGQLLLSGRVRIEADF